MAKTLLDTNVIVSSVISKLGASRQILEAWHARKFDLVTSPALIAEVARVLRYERIMRRYRLSDEDVRSVLALLWTQGNVVEDPTEVEAICGDPDDDVVLAVCKAGGADFLVTGDRLLLVLREHAGTQIVTPRQYLEALGVSPPS